MLVAISGCSTFQGAPHRAIDPYADLAAIQTIMSATAVADCLGGSEECRNSIVTARKYAIDLRFSEFEQDYFAENRWTGFGSTLAALGLTAAGSLSGTGTAQALAAAAAGVTGGRAAYEREILGERTLLTIDTAMHAQRDIIAVSIRDGLSKSVRDYPLGTALSDLDAYYRAGTVVGALATVTQTIGAQAESAQAELRNVLPFTRSSAALYLQNRFRDGDAAAIRAQMRAAGVSNLITVPRFVRTAPAAQMDAVARTLGWTPATGDTTRLPQIDSQPVAPAPRIISPPPRLPSVIARRPPGPNAPSARQFLRDLAASSGNDDRIRQAMQPFNLPAQVTVQDFINTAPINQLEVVATPLGWAR